MVSVLNVPGHGVQLAGQQFSTVPQFAREVGVALQACLKDHKPGSLVYRSTVTMRTNFVKVPTQDSTPHIPPHSTFSCFTVWFEVVEESERLPLSPSLPLLSLPPPPSLSPSLPPSPSPPPSLCLQLMAEYFPWFHLDGFEGDTNKEEGEKEKQSEDYKGEEGGVRREDEKKLKALELNW